MLEYSLIKQHRPRFNIRLRDDKSYPFLAVTLDDEWPRAMVMRGRKRKGVRYFGPYGHAYAIRETLDLLLRTFPIRTCSDNKFATHQRLGRPVPAVPHREVQRARASARSTSEAYDRARRRAARASSTATPTRSSSASTAEMREAAGRPRVRAGGAAARPAHERAPRRSRSQQMVGRPQRGPRRDRHRRRRPRGGGAGVLRAQGPGRRAQGLRRRQGRGPRRPTGLVARVLEGLYDEEPPLGVPKQVLVPDRARASSTSTRSG